MPRMHCVIRGRVQGVGFRYFAEHSAVRHGLRGWVRNLWGGMVETEVEGPQEALEEYLKELQRGPALAHVMDVDVDWPDGEGLYSSFEVRPTD